MRIELSPATAERVGDLVGALDRLAKALTANTKAIEQRNNLADYGPRR